MDIIESWRGLKTHKLPLSATHVAYLICGGKQRPRRAAGGLAMSKAGPGEDLLLPHATNY